MDPVPFHSYLHDLRALFRVKGIACLPGAGAMMGYISRYYVPVGWGGMIDTDK